MIRKIKKSFLILAIAFATVFSNSFVLPAQAQLGTGLGPAGTFIILFAPIYNRNNIARMKKAEYQKMLSDQERPGNYGFTDTIETLEIFEDEDKQMAVALETQGEKNPTDKLGITIRCTGGEPEVYFYLGLVPKRQNISLKLWTATETGPRTYHDPQSYFHQSQDYYSPILTGEAARKAANDILQANGTFGNSAGTKVWLPDEHDFEKTRQNITCL